MSSRISTRLFSARRVAVVALWALLLGCLPSTHAGVAFAASAETAWLAAAGGDQPAKPEVGRTLRGGKVAGAPAPAPPVALIPAASADFPPNPPAAGAGPARPGPADSAAYRRPAQTGPPTAA